MPRLEQTLPVLSWLVPGVLFLLAGLAKVVHPEGEAPRRLSLFLDPAFHPTLLRTLGLFEAALGTLLLTPHARRAGSRVALVAVALLSVFVAWNADDTRFLENCGCFGAFTAAWSGEGSDHYFWILARNALLFWLITMGCTGRARGDVPRRPCWSRSVCMALFFFAGTSWIAEAVLRSAGERRLAAFAEGVERSAQSGWELPDIEVVTASQERRRAHEELQDGDHLIFFSSICPHCERSAPRWADLAARLEAQGSRLVLVSINSRHGAVDFLQRHGAADLKWVSVEDQEDLARLGIRSVPAVMVLGEGRKVVFQETGEVRSPRLDFAVEVDEGGVIGQVIPLRASFYAAYLDPRLRALDLLHGLSVADAVRLARRLSKEPGWGASVWSSLGVLLGELKTRPGREAFLAITELGEHPCER